MIAIGLDLGTGGARAVALDLRGRLVAEGRSDFPAGATTVSGACIEQDPQAWTEAACSALRQVRSALPAAAEILGIAVDATSGTFLLVDAQHMPLTRGLMYDDLRATAEADEVSAVLASDLAPYGIQIAASFALPKIVHLARTQSELFARCRRVVHQTDWIVGLLCGRYDVTDVSTGLKTGVDPGRMAWPPALESLGVSRDLLPAVVAPGTTIGQVTAQASEMTGLPRGTPVVAGCTDGTAGCLASGARQHGDLNVTLGTTLVFKAVAAEPLLDPQGAVYNHRHPEGGYLPGAASSTGGDWIERHFARADLPAMNAAVEQRVPTDHLAYPLVKRGERFPFASPAATGFGLDIADPVLRFAAGMEGVAFLERLGIERLEALGLAIGPTVYATGGGAASDTWLRIRASVNRRSYAVPRHAECALGAAVLAAMPRLGSCAEAISRIVSIGKAIDPEPRLVNAYEDRYPQFVNALRERGYF